MPPNGNGDGRVEAEGEFTLFDVFWDRLKAEVAAAAVEAVDQHLEDIKTILLEDIALGDWHDVLNFELTAERVNESIDVSKPGNIILPISLAGTAQIRLDTPTNQSWDLVAYQPIKLNYEQLFLSNLAQSGESLRLLVGRGDFTFPQQAAAGMGKAVVASTLQTIIDPFATYSFPWFDALNYGRVVLACYTTGGSAVNGVRVEQSIDTAQVDYDSRYTAPVRAPGLAVSVELVARWVRITYIHTGGHVRMVALARPQP